MPNLPEMPDVNKEVPDAFHGTNWITAQKIMSEGFKVMGTPGSYLGDGVYFYEGSVSLARYHVTIRKREKQYGIFQARIKLGKCLDLNTPEHYGMLQDTRDMLVNRVKDVEDLTDTFIINFFASTTVIDTVKWTMCSPASEKFILNLRSTATSP